MSIRQKSAERRTVYIPPLSNGDRLTQSEFHRRYEAMPNRVKAELIGGTVYMASPLEIPHADYHPELSGVFWFFAGGTPGIRVADNGTTILGETSEPQPDLALRILPEFGGLSRRRDGKLWLGPAELLAEIAFSSVSIDLSGKKTDYQRAGVLEYLVFDIAALKLHWFDLANSTRIEPDSAGIFRSLVFPGLWLDSVALINCNTTRLVHTVSQGLGSPEHAAFVKRLETQRRRLAKKKPGR